jgi:RNA polymerase sigma factor (TIGR02999 family)
VAESILPFWQRLARVRDLSVRETPLTDLIVLSQAGDKTAEAELVAAVYPELRRLARRYLSAERKAHTLQTTELIHEAWLRLFGTSAVSVQNRNHLVALMATQMRRALVDYARHRNAAKGPGAAVRVALTDVEAGAARPDEDVLAIDEALTALEAVDARVSKVVELRFFGGLREDEAATALGVSVSTLKRDWAFARAWLYDRLAGDGPDGDVKSSS